MSEDLHGQNQEVNGCVQVIFIDMISMSCSLLFWPVDETAQWMSSARAPGFGIEPLMTRQILRKLRESKSPFLAIFAN